MATINNPTSSSPRKFYTEGLTFDDVLLMPAYSEVLPRDVNIESKLTSTITLNIPMLSAAMDTVTEASLAIAPRLSLCRGKTALRADAFGSLWP